MIEWQRPSSRRGRLTLEVPAGAPLGLRGLELRPAGASEREALRDQVFIINDFGLYQASNLPMES